MIAGHREAFEEKFLKHFKYREIGASTVDEFLDNLEARLLDYSPIYMQRYLSEGRIKNPLVTEYMVESFTRKNDRKLIEQAVNSAQTASSAESRSAAISDGTQDTTGNLTGTGTSHENQQTDTNEKVTKHVEHEETGTKGSTTKTEGTNNFTEDVEGTKDWEESDIIDSTRDTTTDGTQGVVGSEAFYDTPQSQTLPPLATQITSLTNTNSDTTTHTDVNETGHSEENKGHNENTTTKLDHKGNTTGLENYDDNTTKNWTEDSEQDTIGEVNRVTDGTTGKTEETSGNQTTHGESSGTENTDSRVNSVGSKSSESDRLDFTEFSRNQQGRKGVSEMELIEEFRKTFLNVDLEIISYCEPLFIGVYNYER